MLFLVFDYNNLQPDIKKVHEEISEVMRGDIEVL